MEGMNGVEEPQVQNVAVWTVRRLVDELDVLAISCVNAVAVSGSLLMR